MFKPVLLNLRTNRRTAAINEDDDNRSGEKDMRAPVAQPDRHLHSSLGCTYALVLLSCDSDTWFFVTR